MKAFRFTLAQVLRHREWLEEEAKKKLAIEQGLWVEIQNEIRILEDGFHELWGGTPNASVLDCANRMQRLEYSRHLGFVIEHRKKDMDEQATKVNEASRVLINAAQNRKALEKLRERQYQRYLKERGRRTAFLLDEVSANFFRRGGESLDDSE